jgi:sulfofructose kinase
MDQPWAACQISRSKIGPVMTRILCIGIVVVDFVYRYGSLPRGPGKHIADGMEAVVGGMAANAAVAATRLGARAALLSRVGEDPNGTFALAELEWHGLDLRGVEHVRGVPTSLSAVAVDDEGERMLFNHQDRRLLLDADAPPEPAYRQFDAVLDDTRWPAAGSTGLQLARARGVPAIADIDHEIEPRWLASTLSSASHVVFSRDGLAACLGIDGVDAGLAEARRLAPGRIAVTLGADGVAWLDGTTVRHLPAFPVRAVDTLGAGDVFHGALAVALAEGRPWPDALVFASAAAAVKCSRPSGRGSFPTRADLQRLMEQRA